MDEPFPPTPAAQPLEPYHSVPFSPQEIISKSGVGIHTSLSYCHYSINDTTLE
jgi:hypothetical protein